MSELLGILVFCIFYIYLVSIAFSASIFLGILALIFVAPALVVLFGALGILR